MVVRSTLHRGGLPPSQGAGARGACGDGGSTVGSSSCSEVGSSDDAALDSGGSDADPPDDPGQDIPDDAYIACGSGRSQTLGRTMHGEYGTAVPVASMYAGRARGRPGGGRGRACGGGEDDEDDPGEDLGGAEDDDMDERMMDDDDDDDDECPPPAASRRPKRARTSAPAAPRAGGAAGRGGRGRARGAGGARRRGRGGAAHPPDPSLRDLSGLWDSGGDDDDDDDGGDGGGSPPPPPPQPDGDDGGDPVPPPLDAAIARAKERCWLCTFTAHPLSRQISNYVCASVASVDTLHMASQIKGEILDRFPHAVGARRRDIVRHITEHMLAPNVKLAAVLRSLVTMAETLRGTMHQRDPVTGDVVVDLKSTEVYLKVLTQITSTYKLDPSKLMFNGNQPAGGQQGHHAGGQPGRGE